MKSVLFSYSQYNCAFLCFNKMFKHSIYVLNKCPDLDINGFILLFRKCQIRSNISLQDGTKILGSKWHIVL